MRNLKLVSNKFKYLDCLTNKDIFEFCIDSNTNKIYILFNDGTTSLFDNTVDDKISLDNFHITNSPPIRLMFLSVTSEISVIDTESISIFNQDLSLCANHTFNVEIIAAEYSPAQDLLVVVTKEKSVQLLSLDAFGVFTITNDIKLDDHKIISKSINVGWGSKETQFHGLEGKGARNVKDIPTSLEIGDGNVHITWRGDGSLFAVSFLRGENYAFVVLDKDGVPQYSSEFCKGLEAPLCWRPSGNLISGVQLLSNKYQIVFFEKNGLRHGEFTIDKEKKVKKLCWSSDSEILCIMYTNNQVDLWTTNNYHWYLKQSLIFNATTHIIWDSGFDTHSGKILYAISDKNLITYEWIWTTNHSSGLDSNDSACVGVIDGTKVLMTSFKKAIVPPPMCACSLDHTKPINMILFNESNNLCVIQNDYICYHYECFIENQFRYELKRTFSFPIEENSLPLIQNHFMWIKDNIFLSFGNNSIVKHTVQDDLTVITESITSCNEIVTNLVFNPKNQIEVFIQSTNGNIYNLNILSHKMIQIYKIPSPCYEMKLTTISDHVILFVLDRFNRFYVNDTCIANNITSFYIHSDFLLLTTSKHYLICAPLLKIDALKQNLETMYMRRVERGARIVCAVQNDKRVILQMPRGNLEAINPRAMSIQMVNVLINSTNYFDAFKIMKVERINLNLLYDYKPDQFIENVDKFIVQINDPIHLNMFLLELQDEDVTQTMYATCYDDSNRSKTNVLNKKNLIADKMLDYFLNNDRNKYLLTIVTAFVVKRTQNDLENALQFIFNAKQEGSFKSAEKALEHLLLLIPINELYNIALGMYNFDLIMFVATKSQKDPKEYIPFLNDLNKLDENYKRYSIDNYLKRYTIALKSIIKCENRFEECLHFIKVHKLFKDALKLYAKYSIEYKAICEAFGEFLLDKRCYNEAAIMFQRSGNLKQAFNMYKLCFNWRECLILARQLKYNVVQFNELCRNLVEDLKVQRNFMNASTILVEYLNDYEEAIDALTDGRFWSEALRLVYLSNRLDLIETHVKPKILQHKDTLISSIERTNEQFRKQKERLAVVRTEKQKNQQFHNDYSGDGNRIVAVDSDLFSDTASVLSKSSIASKSSTSSFRSFRSSKNRRKHERKLHSLKEGSKFEDIALIRSLHQLITNTLSMRNEVHDLCTTLMQFTEDEMALTLQHSMNSLLKLIKESENEIWSQDMLSNHQSIEYNNGLCYGPNMTSNSVSYALQSSDIVNDIQNKNILEPQFQYPPEQGTLHWKLFTLE